MANCCSGPRCTCRVVAGTGTTVTGSGSAANPYTISTDSAATTALAVQDSTTVDLGLTGTGSASDPYEITADVILDPNPPGGGSNLARSGPGGLYLECADVRGCLTGGEGITYDPTTGEIDARPSTDAGNAVTFGTDGGLYAPASSSDGTTVVQAVDSPTVDVTVSGTGTAADPYEVGAAVILDPAPPGGGSNLAHAGPNGVYVECADVRGCLTAGDGITYDPTTGEIDARVSADAGNTTTFGTDGGIFTPAGAATALQAGDTNTVDTTVSGSGTAASPFVVKGDVIVAPGSNGLAKGASGLVVAPSADAGNQLEFGADGKLFVPPDPPLEIGCGLQGAGTAASPLAAFPIAASRAWATDWNCDPAANSTLHCDPSSGALWTPPEHTSAAVTVQQNHPIGTPTVNSGTSFVLVDPSAWGEATYTADSLTTCRGMTYSVRFNGHVELTWPANAQWELGYAIQINGGALAVRVLHGVYVNGPARHERYSFGVSQASVLPPHTGYAVRVYPAVHVIAGSVTFNQWLTDTDLIVITR